MAVGAVGSSTTLTSALQAKGLSSDKAQLVQQDLVQSVTDSTDLDGTIDGKEVRAKLDKQISADVKSGKLTEDDAAAIGKLLDKTDEIDLVDGNAASSSTADTAQASPAGGAGGPGGAGGGGGGGGGGGSTEKTELSRTVEIAHNVKTTTIKYTDGTSEVKTGFTPDKGPKEKVAADATKDANAKKWLAKIEPGTLVDKMV